MKHLGSETSGFQVSVFCKYGGNKPLLVCVCVCVCMCVCMGVDTRAKIELEAIIFHIHPFPNSSDLAKNLCGFLTPSSLFRTLLLQEEQGNFHQQIPHPIVAQSLGLKNL